MTAARRFAQVDVFSSRPYSGNPVAVLLDAGELSDEEMQRIAAWTNLSETTFVLPPRDPGADYRVRIFTPRGELPFAGHPTLGTAHAWLENGGRAAAPGLLVQECGAGLVQIRRNGDTLAFQAPPLLREGELSEEELTAVVRALGVEHGDVLAHQWVDNGPGWCVVRLRDAEAVLALEPDFTLLPEGMVGAVGAHPDGSAHAFEIRAFAPGAGVHEDPVTGSLNASVGAWLIRTGAAPAGFTVSQGTRLGRSGVVSIAAASGEGTAPGAGAVWTGGATTTSFAGTWRS